MTHDQPTPTNEFTLLCEWCGYVLTGLDPSSVCPECGKPIRESVPDARPGSPWQQRSSIGSWLATLLMITFQPSRVMSAIRIDVPSASSLLRVNLIASALIPTVNILLWFKNHGGGDVVLGIRMPRGVRLALLGCVMFMLMLSSEWILTFIETCGIRFFGRNRGWRITRAVAWSICAHASFGWVLGSILMVVAWNIGLQLPATVRHQFLPLWAAGGAFLVGMLLFEFPVYRGVRACPFANRQAPAEHTP